VFARLAPLIDIRRDRMTSLWRRGQELGAVRADLPVGVVITMAQGLKRAAACAQLPAERSPTDGEIEAFTHFREPERVRALYAAQKICG
jgi:hypothetical protein